MRPWIQCEEQDSQKWGLSLRIFKGADVPVGALPAVKHWRQKEDLMLSFECISDTEGRFWSNGNNPEESSKKNWKCTLQGCLQKFWKA